MEPKSVSLCGVLLLLLLCLEGVLGRVGQLNFDQSHSRIVGGDITTQGQFPSMVALYHNTLLGSAFLCGGTLLNENHVLTAAQCLKGYSASSIDVVAGDQNLNDNTGLEMTRSGLEKFMHDFSTTNGGNDIAILKTSADFVLQPGVIEAVPLPIDYQEPSGNCTAVGWGYTVDGGSISPELRAVELPPISDEECAEIFAPEPILMDMLCAGVFGGAGVCTGDGGGPLFCDGVQMGIVSRGLYCDAFPAIFTEVSHYLDWINIHAQM